MSRATPRFTGLVLGSMAEVSMGGTLLVWLNHPDSAGRALFDSVGSEAVLITGMVALAVAMLVLAFAAQLSKVVLRACVIVVSLPVAGIGALAVGGVLGDPEGPFLLLATAWVLSVVVLVAISRAGARRADIR